MQGLHKPYQEFVACDHRLSAWAKELDDTDIYEVVALQQAEVDLTWVALQKQWKVLSQAFLCMLVQLVVPLLVGMHSMMQILTPEDQSAIEWENVCWGRTEWELANILTKVVGSIYSSTCTTILSQSRVSGRGRPPSQC